MTGRRVALDSNVLVYLVDSSAGPKRTRAQQLVSSAAGLTGIVLPLQAVGEFHHALARRGYPRAELALHARWFMQLFPTVAAAAVDAEKALAEAAAARLQYWDGLLLATVARHGCTHLLSEDLQDGGVVLGVTVLNPFAGKELPAAVQALLDAGSI